MKIYSFKELEIIVWTLGENDRVLGCVEACVCDGGATHTIWLLKDRHKNTEDICVCEKVEILIINILNHLYERFKRGWI